MQKQKPASGVPADFFPNDEAVEQVINLVAAQLPPGIFGDGPEGRQLAAAAFRFSVLARCFPLARGQHGVALAAVARALKVSPAKLKRLEAGLPPDAPLLLRYVSHLGLDDYYSAWCDANPAMAEIIEAQAAAQSRPSEAPDPRPLPRVKNLVLPPLLPSGINPALALGNGSFEDAPANLGKSAPAPAKAPAIYQFKITLRDVHPPVWRSFQVSNQLTLEQLHAVIQDVMGWECEHLHEFLIRGTRFGTRGGDDFGDELMSDRACRLAELGLRARSKLYYHYDFGDDWRHDLVVEKVLPPGADAAPVCLAGARACPMEDCGGPYGYAQKLEILHDPAHPEYEETRDWVTDDFDPEKFDCGRVNSLLAELHAIWTKKPRKSRKSARK